MNRRTLKRIVPGILFLCVLCGCATMNKSSYEGHLQSGDARSGYLHSADLWLFTGEQGSRIVVADAVKPGETPPEIYLFAPESTVCEASDTIEHDCCRVLDHQLRTSGEYTVVIYRSGADHEGSYTVSLAKLPDDGRYLIDPDDPNGDIIKSDCILPEECISRWKVAMMAGIPVVTPYMTAPAAVLINSGLGTIGKLLDFHGRERARIMADPEHAFQIDSSVTGRE